jgi:hypothetical protein
MTEFAARIRRVRHKDGADVHILRNPMPDTLGGDPENWRGKIVEHAKSIASHDEKGSRLDGYVVIGLFSDFTSSIAFRFPERLPPCLVPGYVTELLRRDAIMSTEAERKFDEKFEWVE